MTLARSLGITLLACALVLTGCAQPATRRDFDKDAAKRIRTILLAQSPNQESFATGIPADLPLGFTGTVLDAIVLLVVVTAAVDSRNKTSRLTAAVDPIQTRLQDRFSEMLREGLNALGYEVRIVVLPASGEPDQFLPFLRQQGPADAALVAQLDGWVGQVKPDHGYYPLVSVRAKGFELASGTVLYEDTFSYGQPDPQSKSRQFPSDAKYRFTDIDAMVADPSKVREGWLAGMRLIADKILADVKSKPE